MFVFTKLDRTCIACPSQWDAWDAEGNYYYIRYRHGHLSVDKAASSKEWYNSNYESLISMIHGDILDGSMTDGEMLELIGATVQ